MKHRLILPKPEERWYTRIAGRCLNVYILQAPPEHLKNSDLLFSSITFRPEDSDSIRVMKLLDFYNNNFRRYMTADGVILDEEGL